MSKKRSKGNFRASPGEAMEVELLTVVVQLAALWSAAFGMFHVSREKLEGMGSVKKVAAQLQEAAGMLYRHRAVLRDALGEEVYNELAEAASFDLFELGVRMLNETGDLQETAKRVFDEVVKRQSETS